MAKRRFLPIDRVPLVGGAPAVDLVNTTGARESAAARERLLSYPDILIWCRRTQVLSVHECRHLAAEARRRPEESARVHQNVLEFRELLYRVFHAVMANRAPAAADVEQLNRLLLEANRRRRLAVDAKGGAWCWSFDPAELDQMLWLIVQSGAALLTSERMPRLRKCGECDWLFLDVSKNQRRRWCKAGCRDRVKSRRYYRRHRRRRVQRP